MIGTMEELFKELDKSKPVVIYGAGWAGRVLYGFLTNHNVVVSLFVVTEQKQEWELEGVRVCSLNQILKSEKLLKENLFLAATENNRCLMKKELEKRNISSYMEFSDGLLYEMAKENRKIIAEKAEKERKGRISDKSNNVIGYLIPGYLDSDYAEQRLIIGKVEDATYQAIPKETIDIPCAGTEYETKPEIYRQLVEACYQPDRYVPDVDLIHTFNTVCNTDKPWCASFETAMPRMVHETEYEKKYYLQLVDHMKKNNCRALYAFSQNAYEIQKKNLAKVLITSKDVELLMKKTKILHPPQKILISEKEFWEKHNFEKIHFIFVGRGFFFKGGREIIQVLSEFKSSFDFELTLISSLLYNDYFTRTSYEEMVEYQKIIRKSKWISYYESLPNAQVLDECRNATVGLLPSVADTYGYAVLEMQAAGCPVITTNVRAFPEINNEECGWICNIPVNDTGFCCEHNTEVWSEILKSELRKCFLDIFNFPEKIREKGEKSMERIRKMHDPYNYQKELRKNLNLHRK